MKRAFRGFTIVEVMLVLVISMVMLIAALTIFRGSQAETEYTQSIQDLSSEILNVGSKVSAGAATDSAQFDCQLDAGPVPVVVDKGSVTNDPTGNRAPCVFLGQALQVIPGSNVIYIYTILGLNVYYHQGKVPSSPQTIIDNSDPNIAQTSTNKLVLDSTYKLTSGSQIVTSKVISGGAVSNSYLVSIYTSLTGITPANGSPALQIWGYNVPGNLSVAPVNGIVPSLPDNCIKTKCAGTVVADKWDLCMQNSSNDHFFLLTVESADTGITTHTTDNGCNGT